MSKIIRISLAILLVIGAVVMIISKKDRRVPPAGRKESISSPSADKGRTLPRMIDLGADKCIPCKKMAPILEEIKKDYQGIIEIEFIDVWKDPSAGAKYNIQMIPTQIFYTADGKELTRHQGFMGKDDILGTFRHYGVKLEKPEKRQ